MPNEQSTRIYNLLAQLPAGSPKAIEKLIWDELDYERVNTPLPTRQWPAGVRDAISAGPSLFARHKSTQGNFDVILTRIKRGGRPDFPLSLTLERQIVGELLDDHPYALFLFADPEGRYWHFVNVRPDGALTSRRVFRRIAVGPGDQLRTAAERITMLAIGDKDSTEQIPAGAAPLAVQQGHDRAFDVEAVTQEFFREYHAVFDTVEARITGFGSDTARKRLFTQRLFNRLMFIAFIQKKGWLQFGGRTDYLTALWERYGQQRDALRDESGQDPNFYRDRLKLLFFSALNTPNEVDVIGIRRGGVLSTLIGDVPYLNGGLFEEDDDDHNPNVVVPDVAIRRILQDLFACYNFTVTESTPLDVEVAVDPEMLGKVFEELVTGRHETGSYYTPKPVVAFMCRQGLKGYLGARLPAEDGVALERFVDNHDAADLRDPEALLEALRAIKAVDPACGSGAYLLGMLHELLDLRAALFASKRLDAVSIYQRKLEIIQNSLYGVDVDPFAVNIARLRLWLSLSVDFEGEKPEPLPNLDFKIEQGDSLLGPNPTAGVAGGFRSERLGEFKEKKRAFLMAHGEEKKALRREIEELREELALLAGRTGKARGFDWGVEFYEAFGDGGGFDVVVANPPYVRADAQFKHIEDEDERQDAITNWKLYRLMLKATLQYETLYERWDLYIPFLERGWQLLGQGGRMIFIIPDAYNAAKYASKSHNFFVQNARIERLDFCSEIPLFNAGVYNTIVHFAHAPAWGIDPVRVRRWGDSPNDFEANAAPLESGKQADWGTRLFRLSRSSAVAAATNYVLLNDICYVSYGLRANADERYWQGDFVTDDLISDVKDAIHLKPFVEGKDILRWAVRRVRYLEWGTYRAPGRFARPTFPELHDASPKLIALVIAGGGPPLVYDELQLVTTHTSCIFVPWHQLAGVVNLSIKKTAKYKYQDSTGDRERREALSCEFDLKYLLAVMHSSFVADWLVSRRRSKNHVYPDDWKDLPIPQIAKTEQAEFVRLVDAILAEYQQHGHPLPQVSAGRVAELEREIDEKVAALYGGTA